MPVTLQKYIAVVWISVKFLGLNRMSSRLIAVDKLGSSLERGGPSEETNKDDNIQTYKDKNYNWLIHSTIHSKTCLNISWKLLYVDGLIYLQDRMLGLIEKEVVSAFKNLWNLLVT